MTESMACSPQAQSLTGMSWMLQMREVEMQVLMEALWLQVREQLK